MSDQFINQKPDYILGLDLGKSQDFTALAVLERRRKPSQTAQDEPKQMEFHYLVSYMKRWPLKTSYPEIVTEVGNLVQSDPLSFPMLAVDETGVGVAIVDMFSKDGVKASLRPILIHGGHEISFVGKSWHVPKKELVSTIQLLLQTQRIKFAQMPERELLVQELRNFRSKITVNANETFEARDREHDDMVLAVAMAAWLGERGQLHHYEFPTPVDEPPRRSIYDRASSGITSRVVQKVFGNSLRRFP